MIFSITLPADDAFAFRACYAIEMPLMPLFVIDYAAFSSFMLCCHLLFADASSFTYFLRFSPC